MAFVQRPNQRRNEEAFLRLFEQRLERANILGAATAEQFVPVDTGDLRRSIRVYGPRWESRTLVKCYILAGGTFGTVRQRIIDYALIQEYQGRNGPWMGRALGTVEQELLN
jgi:hypothetical protein